MKVLIVDDLRINRMILSSFCQNKGYDFLCAENGREAIERFHSDHPDLILMDVNMPEMDGFEATRRIRALSKDRWVPILLVTALSDDENLAKGISSGADDYLCKPVNFKILGEKMKVMQRIADMQNASRKHLEALKFYQEQNEEELRLAKHVLEHLTREISVEGERFKKWTIPAKTFSGDIVAAAMVGKEKMHMILADGTGHGLTSAICMVPVTEIFYVMTEKGFPIEAIAREINKKMHFLLPRDRFVAGVLAAVNWLEQTVEIWNGGGPDIHFVTEGGSLSKSFPSTHLPLGILKDALFDPKTDFYQWMEAGELFFYSDGLSEARNPKGESFGEEGVKAVIASEDARRFEHLREALQAHLSGGPAEDDISLVAIRCDEQAEEALDLADCFSHPGIRMESMSELRVRLDPGNLKSCDILPTFLAWLKRLGISKIDSQQAFLILTELLNNSLDHGLLRLDSAIKSEANGFDTYLRLRSERLQQLKSGSIDIHLECLPRTGGDVLLIVFKDSGPGFDYEALVQSGGTALSGRGIALIRQLSKKVAYLNEGKEVRVEYLLGSEDKTESS